MIPLTDLRAPRFPLQRGPRGYFAMSVGEDVLHESVQQIVGTRIGERVMRPDFGCEINDYVFEPLDPVLQQRGEFAIKRALTLWEPRIEVTTTKVTSDSDNHQVLWSVRYVIRATGRFNESSGSIDTKR